MGNIDPGLAAVVCMVLLCLTLLVVLRREGPLGQALLAYAAHTAAWLEDRLEYRQQLRRSDREDRGHA